MIEPDNKKLDELRKEGFRPGVVACILHNKKLLFLYKVDHKLWQLPQGGIEVTETYKDSLLRNMKEELGDDFANKLDIQNATVFEEDRMEFKPGKHIVEPLELADGSQVDMLGKHYFFCAVSAQDTNLNINETQFDQSFWVTFREGYFLADKMYQKGKRRVTIKALTKLNEMSLLE